MTVSETPITATLSTGETVTIDVADATCAKCHDRIIRIAGTWGHADELVSRPGRHWMGGRYDHRARP